MEYAPLRALDGLYAMLGCDRINGVMLMDYEFYVDDKHYIYDVTANRIQDVCYDSRCGAVCVGSFQSVSSAKIYVELTRKCNLSCKYCYLVLNKHECHGECSTDVKYHNIIATLDGIMSRIPSVKIVFYGGEPLMEKSLLYRMMDYYDARALNDNVQISYGITTNGTLLDKEIIDHLCARNVDVTISLDGEADSSRKGRGIEKHEHIDKCVRLLADQDNPVSIIATMTPDTIVNIDSDIRYLVGLPIKSLKYVSCDSCVTGAYLNYSQASAFCRAYEAVIRDLLNDCNYECLKLMRDLLSAIEILDAGKRMEHPCGYGKDVFAISHDGSLFPCPCFMGNVGYEITKTRIKYPDKHLRMNCSSCVARNTCGGGCMYTRYVARESKKSFVEAKCAISRFMLRLALDVYVRLYAE